VRAWQSTYRGIIPDEFLKNLTVSNREAGWRRLLRDSPRGHVICVAQVGSQVVGAASGTTFSGVPGYDANLEWLYLLPEWHRRGVGRELVAGFAHELRARNIQTMVIWVLARNERARKFYQALGGVEITREWEFIGVTPLEKVAYGWSSLRELAGRERSRDGD
jgi:GNAT superfamily N-acetyltransferase